MRLAGTVLPHTKHPESYYWIRVLQPHQRAADLWILRERHIYLSDPLVSQADDTLLTALLAHGIAHHELHHHPKRGVVQSLQYVAFLASNFLVPGLGFGWFVADPLMEAGMSFSQEFTADAKTVVYLESLGYPATEYLRALEFLQAHRFLERTGSKKAATQTDFSRRIAALKKRHAAVKAEAPSATLRSETPEEASSKLGATRARSNER